jgi:hypothetical protein
MKKLLSALTLAFCLSSVSAQQTSDAGLWATLNIDKKVSPKFSLFLTQEFRMRENISRINLFYTDIGVEYRPFKWGKTALSYRSIQKNRLEDNTYSYRHRIQWDIILKKKAGKFALSYRHRLQREVRDINSSDDGYLPEWYSRHKFAVKYDTDKIVNPYISAEYRYQIRNPRQQEVDGLWHRQRYVGGIDFRINGRNTFGVYYLYQTEFDVSEPQNLYVIGLEYSISL